MIIRHILLLSFCFGFISYSCDPVSKTKENEAEKLSEIKTIQILHKPGSSIQERFNPPEGYRRTNEAIGSFAAYLRSLPLKPHGSMVHTYNGYVKDSTNVYVAVVDMDIGNKDLQQCADIIMRLRAEYLYGIKDYEKIHFNFVNGFNAEYIKWTDGYRIKIRGNNTRWVRTSDPATSYDSFQKYLDWVYMYAGTASLEKELNPMQSINEIRIGDVFIQGGSPGHAVIVVDLAVDPENNEKVFILAQSYMPAQEIQILINPSNRKISPWYKVSEIEESLRTPEWSFSKDQLRRFAE